MRVARLVLGPLQVNCWVIADDLGGPAVVVDPAGDAQRIVEALQGRALAAIVLTHNHFDHIGAAHDLIEMTGAPLLAHEDDAAGLTSVEGTGAALFGYDDTAPHPDRILVDGDVIEAGAVSLTVLHTPGHTPGGICLFAEGGPEHPPHLFSGDTLFAGSVGRTDFAGGSSRALSDSIATQLVTLPAETIVHPGHGPDTTIGRERKLNPFFPRA